MRVQKISAQCVLQFTPSLAASCVLHRSVSRVIHCLELSRVSNPAPSPGRSSYMRSNIVRKKYCPPLRKTARAPHKFREHCVHRSVPDQVTARAGSGASRHDNSTRTHFEAAQRVQIPPSSRPGHAHGIQVVLRGVDTESADAPDAGASL